MENDLPNMEGSPQVVGLAFLERTLNFHLKVPLGELRKICNLFTPIFVIHKELLHTITIDIILSSLIF